MYERKSVVRLRRDDTAVFDATQRFGLVPRSVCRHAPLRLGRCAVLARAPIIETLYRTSPRPPRYGRYMPEMLHLAPIRISRAV